MTGESNHHGKARQAAAKTPGIDFLPAIFLVVALFFLPRGSETGTLNSLSIVFVSIVLEAIPFMLAGSLIGGLIEAFVSRERMALLLPQKRWLTVCLAAAAGILFPVCECAVVPVVRRLIGKGLPLSAAIGYLLGGPIVNPIVAASTVLAYAFDWPIAILRIALGYTIAVTIGLLMGRFFSHASALKEIRSLSDRQASGSGFQHFSENDHSEGGGLKPIDAVAMTPNSKSAACACGCSEEAVSAGWVDKVGSAFQHALEDFLAVGHYLVIGAFIAALAQTYFQRSSFLSLADIPALSVGLMMIMAILLNLCSEADAFIAASFQGIMPLSAQMAFMLTGPMFDLKLLLMYQGMFQRKAIIFLAAMILIVVLVISVGLGWIMGGVP
jgi:uncharacterized membrane protein YraQ (UPF0718 family)